MPRALLQTVLAVLALGLAFAAPGEGAARLRIAAADGSLSLSNSKEGAAVFTAAGMRPGAQASGTVTVGNTGSIDAALKLAPTAIQGTFAERLDLRVVDLANAQTVYSGTLAAMPAVALGALAPGAQRSFAFTATLQPAAGNDLQGALLTTTFVWTATGSAAPTPTPSVTPPVATPAPRPPTTTPTTPPPGVAGADPTGSVLGARMFSMPSTKRCLGRRKFTIRVRRPKGMVFKKLTVKVNRRTKVKLKGLKARKVRTRINLRGMPKGKVVVKVVARTTTGRKAVTKRTYRTCARKRR